MGHDIFSVQNAHMVGLTLKSSYTKSKFKMGLCAFSDVKCNGALNIMEKPHAGHVNQSELYCYKLYAIYPQLSLLL